MKSRGYWKFMRVWVISILLLLWCVYNFPEKIFYIAPGIMNHLLRFHGFSNNTKKNGRTFGSWRSQNYYINIDLCVWRHISDYLYASLGSNHPKTSCCLKPICRFTTMRLRHPRYIVILYTNGEKKTPTYEFNWDTSLPTAHNALYAVMRRRPQQMSTNKTDEPRRGLNIFCHVRVCYNKQTLRARVAHRHHHHCRILTYANNGNVIKSGRKRTSRDAGALVKRDTALYISATGICALCLHQ